MPSVKKPTPQKRVAPRDKEDRIRNPPFAAGEEAAARQAIRDVVAGSSPPEMGAGFTVDVLRVHSCTIEGESIRCMVVFSGTVERPEATAVAQEVTQQITIPAKVIRHD